MLLVVAVALSTATYAWFTSNASVTASTITIKAEVNGASALGIGWLGGDANTSISVNNYSILKPMAPNDLIVDTTTSDVFFRSATIKEEGSVEKFNPDLKQSYVLTADDALDNGKTYYVKADGYFTPVADPDVEDIATYYEKVFAPIVFNDGTVQAFYVKNTSHTNSVGRITVSAVFANNEAYIPTQDAQFKAGSKYYTTPDEGTTFVLADDYDIGDPIGEGYYEKITANDMIRVALFTKAAYVKGSGTPAATYTLLGVLGQKATSFKQVTENDDAEDDVAYDRNTTYYTKSGDVYTQVAIDDYVDGTTYYTAADTAAYGGTGLFDGNDNVKDLEHYLGVATSMTLTNSLAHDAQIDIVAVVWFDGTVFTDARAGQLGQVTLRFSAGA